MSVAPPLGKELASTDKKTRDAAVNTLRDFLETTAEKPMADIEMAKLWKAIFYCFWLSDKPLVQQELASSLADFLLVIPSLESSFHFLKGFWEAIVREWSGLDYLRMDKYYMLVRRFVNASFRLLITEKWSSTAVDEYNAILTGKSGPLDPEDRKVPTSLAYHLADIYNEELDKVIASTESCPPAPLVPLLTPFFNLNALSSVPTTHNRLHTALFTPLFGALLAHSKPQPSTPNYRSTVAAPALSPKDSDNQRRKRARIEPREPPLAALCKNACLAVSPGESDAHVALPPSEVSKGTLKAMFDIASGDDTKEISRKRMYRAWKEATELAEETERADDV